MEIKFNPQEVEALRQVATFETLADMVANTTAENSTAAELLIRVFAGTLDVELPAHDQIDTDPEEDDIFDDDIFDDERAYEGIGDEDDDPTPDTPSAEACTNTACGCFNCMRANDGICPRKSEAVRCPHPTATGVCGCPCAAKMQCPCTCADNGNCPCESDVPDDGDPEPQPDGADNRGIPNTPTTPTTDKQNADEPAPAPMPVHDEDGSGEETESEADNATTRPTDAELLLNFARGQDALRGLNDDYFVNALCDLSDTDAKRVALYLNARLALPAELLAQIKDHI